MRDVVYTELGAAWRYLLQQRALARRQVEGVRASGLASRSSVQAGDEAMTVFTVRPKASR